MKVKGTTAMLFIIAVFAMCMTCYGEEAETLQPNEEIRVDLFITGTPEGGVEFVKNLFLFFNYSSGIDMSLPEFQGFRSASYTIGPETPNASKCTVVFTISYETEPDDTKVTAAASVLIDYFNHSMTEFSRHKNGEEATIFYGYLEKEPKAYIGRTRPEGGFAELLDSYLQEYKKNVTANYYLDKEGNFGVWFHAVIQELLTTEKVYKGTRVVRLGSLFDIESIRASTQNRSIVVFATLGKTDYSTTAKSITPIPSATEDQTTYPNLPQMWYIWRIKPNQKLDDIVFTVQLTANKRNNPLESVAALILVVLISILIVISILRMKRKKHRH